MDLSTIQAYHQPASLDEIKDWQDNWAWLAGGTWFFTEPQPHVHTLIDITRLGWSELQVTGAGITIGATCIMSQLLRQDFPDQWPGVQVLRQAVHELASFKVQNVATVGGNLCLAIPAGTFAPAMVLLDAQYELASLTGETRMVPARHFQTGIRRTQLQPGELLRKIHIPSTYLTWRVSYHRLCVATAGLAIALVLAAYCPSRGQVRFTIGGALPAPYLLTFDQIPCETDIAMALDRELPLQAFLADTLASAAYRRQMIQVLMGRALQDVLPDTPPQ